MNAVLPYTMMFGDLSVSDIGHYVCKTVSLKKKTEYLDIPEIRVNTHTHTHSIATRVKIQNII